MPPSSRTRLEPRKSPVQARSTASVEAILEATIQVLLQVGKDRLTTTRVAARAGVSVGTLYQYFPNKTALLKAVLDRHLETVTVAVECVCKEQQGHTLQQMATALVNTFLEKKIKDGKSSVALYAISADVDGARIAREKSRRGQKAIVAMLSTASEPMAADPEIVASVLQSAMAGVSRRLLESPRPKEQFAAFRQELVVLACTYLHAHAASAPVSASSSCSCVQTLLPAEFRS